MIAWTSRRALILSEIVETISAMYLLLEERPRRFESDAAFSAQLVRRVRGLTLTNAGQYCDHKTGRIKRVYRDAKPKTTAYLAELLSALRRDMITGLQRAQVDAVLCWEVSQCTFFFLEQDLAEIGAAG